MMKKMILIMTMMMAGVTVLQAQTTTPVYIAPVYPNGVSTYQEHGQQGNEMYQNNSQWYNKDNVPPQVTFPSSNGQYSQPGNSNAVNARLYDGNVVPAGTVYDSGVPAGNAGTYPSTGSDAFIRD
jgi:transcription initiation factor TFIID subunit TAF12